MAFERATIRAAFLCSAAPLFAFRGEVRRWLWLNPTAIRAPGSVLAVPEANCLNTDLEQVHGLSHRRSNFATQGLFQLLFDLPKTLRLHRSSLQL